MSGSTAAETILIVDDEAPVRQTLLGWLHEGDLGCTVLAAADAASALKLANEHTIDLAVLDWNLGADNGLQLLEDLVLFNPEVAAIMVTGFAHQATPLHAMRMGVRDYLDKNQDFNKDSFLAAVRKQLDHIRPAKQARRINQGLAAFREAVEQILPLVQSASALNDPVPLSSAVRSLFRFLLAATGASDGVLLVRAYDPARQPAEVFRAYDAEGRPLDDELVPFSRSLAGTVTSMGRPHAIDRFDPHEMIELQPFERGRRNLLAAPMDVAPGVQVVWELFDKPGAFDDADRRLAGGAGEFASELLRQALAERQTYRVLFDAVDAALRAGDHVRESLHTQPPAPSAPPPDVMQRLQSSLAAGNAGAIDASMTLRLAEGIRVLALRYGPRAVEHCARLIEDVRGLLDETSGEGAP
jgi:two-component system nitrogen regulation response regulator NtrX